jgi:hypothetical protein
MSASYWEAVTPTPEEPGREPPPEADVVVAGAGFTGLWLAYWLARGSRRRVVVCERDRLSRGASSRNAGFLTCGQVSEMLSDAREAGDEGLVTGLFLRRKQGIETVLAEFPRLETLPCGSIDFDPLTDEKLALARRLNAACGQEVFVTRETEFGGERAPRLVNALDRAANPVALLLALRLACSEAGVRLCTGVNVESLSGGRCVFTRGGRQGELRFGRAAICTNAFAPGLDAASAVLPGRGQVVVTSPVAARTSPALGYLNEGYDYWRFVDGRLLVGGGRQLDKRAEETLELETTAPVQAWLEALARRVIGHEAWRVEHRWAGIMGFEAGLHITRNPVREASPGVLSVHACGGMGVALAPLIAREAAALLA